VSLNNPVSAPIPAAERTESRVETAVPAEVTALIGRRRHQERATFAAERGQGIESCASVHNANPLFWDDAVAAELTGGPILPPTTLSLWSRPHSWAPGATEEPVPLRLHFELKAMLDLPDAVVTQAVMRFGEPVRPGDVMTHAQTLRSVSDEKVTALGTGRFWVIDVDYTNQRDEPIGTESITGFGYRRTDPPMSVDPAPTDDDNDGDDVGGRGGQEDGGHGPRLVGEVAVGDRLPALGHDVTVSTVVLGAVAARDWRPMHHDPEFARARNGVADVFLDTPTQAAWFERYLTDWAGPTGRLGRLDLRMGRPVVAGDSMVLAGAISAVEVDAAGCGWVSVEVVLTVGDEARSSARARLAIPVAAADNPWSRHGSDWLP